MKKPSEVGSTLKKSVLILEDEVPMARAIELKLQKNGISTHIESNGKDGIDELKIHIYDLLLLDIMMPEMDGWEVLAKIKEMGIKIKVIVTSNLSQEEDMQKAKALGAVDFIVKSDATLESIAEEVKSFL